MSCLRTTLSFNWMDKSMKLRIINKMTEDLGKNPIIQAGEYPFENEWNKK